MCVLLCLTWLSEKSGKCVLVGIFKLVEWKLWIVCLCLNWFSGNSGKRVLVCLN